MGKLNINVTEEIRANADHTWSIVGHQFDDIGAWAAGVSSSQPITGATPPSPSAPSGGRVCQVGKPLGTLHEQLVSYDDSARRLVHTVTSEKMPGPVDDLTLTWTGLCPTDPTHPRPRSTSPPTSQASVAPSWVRC